MAYESVGGGGQDALDPEPLFNPDADISGGRVKDYGNTPTYQYQGDPLNGVFGVTGGGGNADPFAFSLLRDVAAAWGETEKVTGAPSATISTGDPTMDALLQGIDLSGLEPGAAGTTPSARSATPSVKNMLPPWARDLKIVGKPQFTQEGKLYADEGFVYWGESKGKTTKKVGSGEVDFVGGATRPPDIDTITETVPDRDKVFTVNKALNQPFVWETNEIKDAMDRMRQAGIPVESFDQMTEVWNSLVGRAAATFMASKGERKLTPWDVLDLMSEEQGLSPIDPRDTNGDGQFGPGDAGYNGTQVTTQKAITELSEGQAWSVLQSTVSQMLGRDPSDSELRDFTHRMGRLASSNPSISRTVTQFEDGEATGSTTRTKTGFTGEDAAKAAYDRAQNDPDYAEYQSATTYFNALMSALGPIGGA